MFEIAHPSKGRLWIMPCPDAARLAQAVAAYRAGGADRIVSMLAADEAAMLGLADEGAMCAQAGLLFDHHPIVDFGLPDREIFHTLVTQVKGCLDEGQGVAVHCRAGIGRSGMVTAGVLVAMGLDATQAIAQVSQARGVSIPDTVEQGSFIAAFARNLGLNK